MKEIYELPYYAPQSQLPAPLPSTQAIETEGEVILEQGGRRVVRFGKHYIIKYGANISLTEGMNMLFVHETQTVTVPRVFAMYSVEVSEGLTYNYIIMENISGQSLDAVWDELDTPRKDEISRQLRVGLDALRKIPSPGYFGSIGRRPFEESMFWTSPEHDSDTETESISGPFDSEADLIEGLVNKYLYNSGLQHKASYYRRVLPLVLRNHVPVFTHGDFQRKNVILSERGGVVFVDWETAGWYPEYWEYALAIFACGRWQDDWHEYVGRILDEYPNEFAWFDMLRRELWS